MAFQIPEAQSMREAAVQMHEWYTALLEAGFTDYQAMVFIVAAPVLPPPDEEGDGA